MLFLNSIVLLWLHNLPSFLSICPRNYPVPLLSHYYHTPEVNTRSQFQLLNSCLQAPPFYPLDSPWFIDYILQLPPHPILTLLTGGMSSLQVQIWQ